jgi:hypothetical protein
VRARPRRRRLPARSVTAGSPDATYLGNRLLYQAGDESIDPLQNSRYIWALVVRAVFFMLLWVVGEVALFIVGIVFGIVAAQDGTLASLFVLGGIFVNLAWSIGLLCAYWLLPVPALVSEWKLTLDGRADEAHGALDHITASLEARALPIGTIETTDHTIPRLGDRTSLQVREGHFFALVSCFAFGDDLYIGWSYWINLSPARCFLHWCRRMIKALKLKSPIIEINTWFDNARAMREVVHSAVREGVDVVSGPSATDEDGPTIDLVAAETSVDA